MTPEEANLGNRSHKEWLEKHNPKIVDEIYAPDCVIYGGHVPRARRIGREAFKAYGEGLYTAFPDLKIRHDLVVTEEGGPHQMIYWSFEGTHLGPMGPIPPTGRKISMSGVDVFRVEDGLIQELFLAQDAFLLMQQLGIIPRIPDERQFDAPGVTINYAELTSDARPLVLLHGLGLRWQDLWPLLPPLGDDWHLYATDFRGHGKSGRAASADGYRYTDYIADTVAFLRTVVGKPAVLVGHSLGSLIALGAAAAAPDLVSAIILLDPPFHSRNTKMKDAAAYGWFSWLEKTARSGISRAELVAQVRGALQGAPEIAVQGMADTIAAVNPDAIAMVLQDRVLEGYDFDKVLSGTTCPALIFQADPAMGGALRDVDVAWARETMPHVTFVQVPKAGHSVFRDQTDVVVKEIRAFLAKAAS